MRNLNVDPRSESIDATRIHPAPSFAATAPAQPAPAQPAPAARPKVEAKVAVLGQTLHFKGELSAEEDFILQGKIEGSINHTQSVTIGVDGSVLGNIHARRITIDGTVQGDLHASESVSVHETARLTGNIFAPRIGIVDGALFNGRVEMVASAAKQGERRETDAPAGVPLSAEETERMMVGNS
jgi:cytoskeletal protein CcmA (bactofilin family)